MNRRSFLALGTVAATTVLGSCRAPAVSVSDDRRAGLPGLDDPARRRAAEAVISSFENSSTQLPYAVAIQLGDGRGITAGRAGFTSGTHDLLMVVQRYEAMADGGPTALTRYMQALVAIDADIRAGGDGADTTGLGGFEDTWERTAQTDPRLNHAQDAVYDQLYFGPAMDQARANGVVSPLGQLILLDTAVQHGTDADRDGLPALITQTDGAYGSGADGDETAWLEEFLEVRRAHLLDPDDEATAEVWRKSVPRVDTLETLLDEGRFELRTPLAWTFAGQQFRLDR